MIGFLTEGLERTMALNGCQTVDDITRDLVAWRSEPHRGPGNGMQA